METNRTATHANEYAYRNGYDYNLASEEAEYAESEAAEEERLDAEARRERDYMLFGE
jgi:uncharacterized Zn ribbon protein